MNEVIKFPEWTELKEKAVTWEYGSSHSHKEISEIMRLSIGSAKYRSMVKQAKDELLKCGKYLKSEHGKGYKVLDPNDYPNEAIHEMNKGYRHIQKAENIAINSPTHFMSSEALQKLRLVSDSIAFKLSFNSRSSDSKQIKG